MSGWIDRMNRRFFPNLPYGHDDKVFRQRVLGVVAPHHVVLDLGAGAGILPEMDFRGEVARVCGVDPDPRVTENPHLDEARVGGGETIPYPDRSFDVVVSDNVLEHLERPQEVFREVGRVLKPGGRFLAKTPNLWHYMPPLAMATPLRFHDRLNPKPGGNREDSFPTRYRANTPAAIRRLAEGAGLRVNRVEHLDVRPGYLSFSAPTYFLGCVYHWLVTRVPPLRRFSIVLIAELEKPAGGAAPDPGVVAGAARGGPGPEAA